MKFPMLRMIDNKLCLISPKWITATWMNVKVKDYGNNYGGGINNGKTSN